MATAQAEPRPGHSTIRGPGHRECREASSDAPVRSALTEEGTGKDQRSQGSGSITKVG